MKICIVAVLYIGVWSKTQRNIALPSHHFIIETHNNKNEARALLVSCAR